MDDKDILSNAFAKMKEHVENQKIKQDEIAKVFDVSRSNVSKILDGKSGLTFERILKFSKAYGVPLEEIFKSSLDEIGIQKKNLEEDLQVSTNEEYERQSLEHLKRIIKTQCATYIGFFVHRKDGKREINHIFIDTFKEVNSSAIPVCLHVQGRAEYSYHGHIVSPPGQTYLYLYLRQDVGENDRGMMIFYYPEGDVVGDLQCTSGMMISTDRNTKKVHGQWVTLIRKDVNTKPWPSVLIKLPKDDAEREKRKDLLKVIDKQEKAILDSEWLAKIDKIIEPHLLECFPGTDDEYIQFDMLEERNRRFHTEHYKQIKDILDEQEAHEKRIDKSSETTKGQ